MVAGAGGVFFGLPLLFLAGAGAGAEAGGAEVVVDGARFIEGDADCAEGAISTYEDLS